MPPVQTGLPEKLETAYLAWRKEHIDNMRAAGPLEGFPWIKDETDGSYSRQVAGRRLVIHQDGVVVFSRS